MSSFSFPSQNSECISPPSHTCYIPFPSLSPWCDLLSRTKDDAPCNVIFSCYVLPLRSTIFLTALFSNLVHSLT